MSSVFRAAGGRIATPPATDEYGLSAQTSVLHREAAERAKIAAKQEVARARIERFQDPRYLTIGVSGIGLLAFSVLLTPRTTAAGWRCSLVLVDCVDNVVTNLAVDSVFCGCRATAGCGGLRQATR
jgi:hypothetical protein